MERILEITVLSAENLSQQGKPVRKEKRVAVRIDSTGRRCTTRMASKGSCPSWNQKLLMDMAVSSFNAANSVTLEVQSKTFMGTVQSIGEARVGVSEFLEDDLQFLSYRLRDRKGRENGINFCIRVIRMPPKEIYMISDPATVPAAADGNDKHKGNQFVLRDEICSVALGWHF